VNYVVLKLNISIYIKIIIIITEIVKEKENKKIKPKDAVLVLGSWTPIPDPSLLPFSLAHLLPPEEPQPQTLATQREKYERGRTERRHPATAALEEASNAALMPRRNPQTPEP